jgi:hypothetical protein
VSKSGTKAKCQSKQHPRHCLDEEPVILLPPQDRFLKLPPRWPGKVLSGLGRCSMRALPSEHQESGLVAHNRDVPLAGRGVLQPKHFSGMKLPRLAIGRTDREGASQNCEKLHRRSGVIETLLQILSAPMLVEPCEERARGWRVAPILIGEAGGAKFIWRSSAVTF